MTAKGVQATIFTALAGFAGLYFLYLLYRYGTLGTYLGHAEPNVTVRAWRLLSGRPLYNPFDAEEFLLIAYGPLLFFVNAAYMALFGASIAASKLGGLVSAGLSVVVFATYAWRAFGGAGAGIGTLLLLCFLLIGAPITFWSRPDPHVILLVTAALYATTLEAGRERPWLVPLVVAVCIGLAVNLKAHAFVYFIPIVLNFCARRRAVTWPLMAALAAAVFLLPFALPQVSLVNYVTGVLSVVGGRAPDAGVFLYSARYALLFVSPGAMLLVVWLVGRQRLVKADGLYFAALFGAVCLALYPSSVPGGFWYHLIPFAPLTVDLLLRLWRALDGATRAQAVSRVLFALLFLILSVTPQKRLLRTFESFSWGAAAAAEAADIVRRFPGRTMEMGYGDDVQVTYKRTFVKPLLAFAGNPVTIDGFSDMEAHYAGLPLPPGKHARIRDCKTELWLIPKGERPFAMNGYYGGKAFWPEYTATFRARYEKRATYRFFDLWGCDRR